MRGVYTVGGSISGLAAAKTVLYLTNAADMALELLAAWIENATNETNEQCEAVIQRITTIGTPTATAATPQKHELGDMASSVTCGLNVTASEPTYTSGAEYGRRGFPSLGGYRWEPTPEERVYVSPSESIGLRLLNSPTAFDAKVGFTFREIGG